MDKEHQIQLAIQEQVALQLGRQQIELIAAQVRLSMTQGENQPKEPQSRYGCDAARRDDI
jgi:hypothetical protein